MCQEEGTIAHRHGVVGRKQGRVYGHFTVRVIVVVRMPMIMIMIMCEGEVGGAGFPQRRSYLFRRDAVNAGRRGQPAATFNTHA